MSQEREPRPTTADILERARALLPAPTGQRPLLVAQVGVVLAFGSAAHGGGREPAQRWLDWLLRRLPVPASWLCDLSGPKIVRGFADQSFRVTIVDDSTRALGVARHTAGADAPDVVRADVGMSDSTALRPLRGAFDIVLALGDLVRRSDEERRARVARNLAALARPDGLVVERSNLLAAAPELSLADFPAVYRKNR